MKLIISQNNDTKMLFHFLKYFFLHVNRNIDLHTEKFTEIQAEIHTDRFTKIHRYMYSETHARRYAQRYTIIHIYTHTDKTIYTGSIT